MVGSVQGVVCVQLGHKTVTSVHTFPGLALEQVSWEGVWFGGCLCGGEKGRLPAVWKASLGKPERSPQGVPLDGSGVISGSR